MWATFGDTRKAVKSISANETTDSKCNVSTAESVPRLGDGGTNIFFIDESPTEFRNRYMIGVRSAPKPSTRLRKERKWSEIILCTRRQRLFNIKYLMIRVADSVQTTRDELIEDSDLLDCEIQGACD